MPEVSVIVTSYNIERYLPECLDGILNQTLRDLEIIVVDDGSTDSSPEIIRGYAAQDPRIVPVLLGENSPGGVATAANAGLDRATAPWVGFADGDDLVEPDMFERLLEQATAYDADLSMCNYRTFTDGSTEQTAPADEHRWAELDRNFYVLDDEARKTFLKFIAVPWRKLYRRSLLEDHAIRFPVGDYFFEDNPFHWFALIHARSIALVPEVLCYHRMARAGQTMQTADERLFRIFEHHRTIYDFLEEQGQRDEFSPTLLSWVISQMEWISKNVPTGLRRRFYDVLVGVFDEYSTADINKALVVGNKGAYARNLSLALNKHNLARFNQVLDGRDSSSNPAVRALYHLRYSGLRKTLQVTGRYAQQHIELRGSKSLGKAAAGRRGRDDTELLFALAVLDQRLQRIEAALTELKRM